MKALFIFSVLAYATLLINVNSSSHDPVQNPRTCLPMNDDNKQLLDKAINDPKLASIWTEDTITKVTADSVFYVLGGDAKCKSLLSIYQMWTNLKHDKSAKNIYGITFHRYKGYYFVVMTNYNDGGFLMSGGQKLHIYDENLDMIDGYAL